MCAFRARRPFAEVNCAAGNFPSHIRHDPVTEVTDVMIGTDWLRMGIVELFATLHSCDDERRPMTSQATTKIVHNQAQSRFDIYLDDVLTGYAEYSEHAGVRDFNHTLTYPQFRGHGLAAKVVEAALDASRADGFKVVPTCWFVDQFIGQHKEYADLLA